MEASAVMKAIFLFLLLAASGVAADRYWVGGAVEWDSGTEGVDTPWGTASGVSDFAAKPVDGDNVFFDGNSANAPTVGPATPVAFGNLNMTGNALALNGIWANITLTASSVIKGATNCAATLGNGANITLGDTSTFSGATSGSNFVTFEDSATNAATAYGGSGNVITFAGSAGNSATFNAHGQVAFFGTANVNSGAITATAITITGLVSGSGSGFLVGPVAISGSGNNVDCATTGNVSVSGASAFNGAIVTGNVNVSNGALNTGVVTGSVTLSGGGANAASVSGTLTVPYSTATGQWGGPWGTLNITGLPSSGGTVGIVFGE